MKVDSTLFSGILADSLARGESVLLRLQGVSMLPWFREGQKVRIVPVGGRVLRKGDVVLFWREPRHPILHRVIRMHPSDGWMDCRGDSEIGEPERVPVSAVIGLVESTTLQRWGYIVLHPVRCFINRLCGRWGIRLSHG